MKNRMMILFLFGALALGALPAFAATVPIVDSSQMNLTAINSVTTKPVGIPVGTVIAWPVSGNPEDADKWLECNGQAISQSVYPELYAVVGGSVPNYQGIFLRGYGAQPSYHYGYVTHQSSGLGQLQGDAIRNISSENGKIHHFPSAGGGPFVTEDSKANPHGEGAVADSTKTSFDASRVVPTAEENRPVNKAVRYLIRAKP